MPSKKLFKPLFASLLMGVSLFSLNSDANSATRTEVKKIVIEEASISNVPAALAMAVLPARSARHACHASASCAPAALPPAARAQLPQEHNIQKKQEKNNENDKKSYFG